MTNNISKENEIYTPCTFCPAFAACFARFQQKPFDSIWDFVVKHHCFIIEEFFGHASQAEINELRRLFKLEPI